MRIDVEIQGSVKRILDGEAAAVVAGSKVAVRRQTDETKTTARAIVSAGLGSRGRARVANTIRSKDYADTPAGFIYSSWGHFVGGKFVDILAAHAQGATISARDKMLFLPLPPGRKLRRNARRPFDPRRVNLIPLRSGRGFLVVRRVRGGGRGESIGILLKQVRLPQRLGSLAQLPTQAEAGLSEKLIVETEIASRKLEQK